MLARDARLGRSHGTETQSGESGWPEERERETEAEREGGIKRERGRPLRPLRSHRPAAAA